MANLVGLAAAIARVAPTVARDGIRALPGDPVVYAATTVHMSVVKAAAILGLGRNAVRQIAVDDRFCIDVHQLQRAISDDRRAGRLPICMVANAGDVNTGAVDPLPELGRIARDRGRSAPAVESRLALPTHEHGGRIAPQRLGQRVVEIAAGDTDVPQQTVVE